MAKNEISGIILPGFEFWLCNIRAILRENHTSLWFSFLTDLQIDLSISVYEIEEGHKLN